MARPRSKSQVGARPGANRTAGATGRQRRNSAPALRAKASGIVQKESLERQGVLSLRLLNSVEGAIYSMDASSEAYKSLYLKNADGPLLALRDLKNNEPETIAEVFEDVGQIRTTQNDIFDPKSAFPRTVVINVNNGPEARDMATGFVRGLLRTRNDRRRDGPEFEHRLLSTEELSSGQTSLVFAIGPRKTPDPKGKGKAKADPPARPVTKLGQLRPLREAQRLEVRPVPPPPEPVAEPVGPPAPARNVPGPLQSLISPDDFKKAAPGRLNGSNRREAFRGVKQALIHHHQQLDGFAKDVQEMKDELELPARQKSLLLKEKFRLEAQRETFQTQIDAGNKGVMESLVALRALEKKDQLVEFKELNRAIEGTQAELQTISKKRNELSELIDNVNEGIQELDGRIDRQMQIIDRRLIFNERRILEAGQELAKKLKQYVNQYGHQDKKDIRAVRALQDQLGNAARDRQRLEEIFVAKFGIPSSHRLVGPMKVLDSDTASDVFQVETKGRIGHSDTHEGFAKRALEKGDIPNETTDSIQTPSDLDDDNKRILTAPPNLIARQVIASRIDRALGLRVLAAEIYSKSEDGATIGVTAKASGKETMKARPDGDAYRYFDFANPDIQRGLADLQILDALTGQLDRHPGNIMIDPETGQVTGIDNDMAFPLGDSPLVVGDNALQGQFERGPGPDQLTYTQTQIHVDTARAILAMQPEDLEALLRTPQDPEQLEEVAIEHTLKRFEAIKAQVQRLEAAGLLLEKFDQDTFQVAFQNGFIRDGDPFIENSNYLARAVYRWVAAGNPDEPTIIQEP